MERNQALASHFRTQKERPHRRHLSGSSDWASEKQQQGQMHNEHFCDAGLTSASGYCYCGCAFLCVAYSTQFSMWMCDMVFKWPCLQILVVASFHVAVLQGVPVAMPADSRCCRFPCGCVTWCRFLVVKQAFSLGSWLLCKSFEKVPMRMF